MIGCYSDSSIDETLILEFNNVLRHIQVWGDHRACIISRPSSHASCSNNGTHDCFHLHLLKRLGEEKRESTSTYEAPWHRPSSCAILLEFRPLKDRLNWSLTNALDNLPVPWCIQVVGSPAVLRAVNASFPVEVLVGKIRLTDLGDGADMTQVGSFFLRAVFRMLLTF